MHADRKPHQVGDQHDPAHRMGLVGLFLPFEHEPHHQGGEHRREGIYFAFDGREPEGVGEGIGECSDRTCTQYGHDVGFCKLRALTGKDAACQVGDRPEKEQDAERAGQAVHGVHHVGYIVRRGCQYRGQAGQQHEERCSGRVPYFEFIRGSGEFGAVPQARRGLHGQQIGHGRDSEDDPADDVVPAFVAIHLSFGLSAKRHVPCVRSRTFSFLGQSVGFKSVVVYKYDESRMQNRFCRILPQRVSCTLQRY